MAKMNNLSTTTTETLPKSGHVNEVCKEWLVREDGALAYKLQSQEINDFYKGNRFRNAVVREDFPTALQEQIKEKETAEQQVESYRRRLREQEEHDKRVAKEIADKLERDLQEQRLRELRDSERVAQEMQEIYVNLPPVPPPSSRDKNKVQPPPPRPAKSSTLQQQHPNDNHRNHHHHHHHHHHQPQQQQQQQLNQLSPKQQQPQQQHQSISPQQYQIQLQQHHFTQNDGGYVGLALQATPAQQRQMQLQQQRSPTNSSNINNNNNNNIKINNNQFVVGVGDKLSPNQLSQPHSAASNYKSSIQGHAETATSTQLASTSSSSSSSRRNVFDNTKLNTSSSYMPQIPLTPNSPKTPKTPTSHAFLHTSPSVAPSSAHLPAHLQHHSPAQMSTSMAHPEIEEIIEYSDVADSIRRYDISTADAPDSSPSSPQNHLNQPQFPSSTASMQNSSSPIAMTSTSSSPHNTLNEKTSNRLFSSPSSDNLLKNQLKFQKLSPEKYDQLVGNASGQAVIPNVIAKERQLQEHVDDIELYVDPCDYSGLKEIGLPMQEIKEMSAKLKQEQKDELLARRLQELEVHDGMSLEERDRMLAIEAQDKQLAKMLQERMDFTTWDILRPGVCTVKRRFSFARAFSGLHSNTFTGILPRNTSNGIREKAKAKRAKEKARLRKSQQQKEPQPPPQLTNGIVALHNGPIQPLPQEHFMTSSSTSSGGSRHNYQQQLSNGPNDIQHYRDNSNGADETLPNAAAAAADDDDDIIDLEPYSSPIDIIKHQQRTQNGCLTNGSLTRDIASQQARQASLLREDDIYTLPVDTCRLTAGAQAVQSQTAALRPASMSIASDSVPHNGYSQNSMTRSENYSIHSHDSLNSRLTSTSSTNSKTHIDQQNASPTPPYMPIQGSRRSNSSEDRKKKSKDNKCTHQ